MLPGAPPTTTVLTSVNVARWSQLTASHVFQMPFPSKQEPQEFLELRCASDDRDGASSSDESTAEPHVVMDLHCGVLDLQASNGHMLLPFVFICSFLSGKIGNQQMLW